MKEKEVKGIKIGECLYRQKSNLTLNGMAQEKASERVGDPFHQHDGLKPSSAISKKKRQVGEEAILIAHYALVEQRAVHDRGVCIKEVCVSNAHIIHTKFQNHASLRALEIGQQISSRQVLLK